MFVSDYPGAIVVEAAQYGYSTKNHPKGFVYHTPEEDADDDPQTPGYLAGTTRQASYTYFVSFLGFVFQLVPESEGAYANGIVDKGYPSWADPAVNLNLQGISVSFEGRAATIHQTMLRGGPQWNASVSLVAHRAEALNINPDNWTRHKDVYTQRGDTGSLDIAAFTQDVKTELEDDMTQDEFNTMFIAALKEVKYPAHDANGQGISPNRTTVRWMAEVVGNKTEIGQHKADSNNHSAGGGYTDADAVKAVKDAL